MQDYYAILGVEKGADDSALKKAYRKQAMQYHPDRNPDDKVAEQKFKEVNEAYDTLKDSEKRRIYDQVGHAAYQKSGGAGGFGGGGGGFHSGGSHGAGLHDIFEGIFGDAFGGGAGGFGGGGVDHRGADLRYNLTITLEQAYAGHQLKIKVPTLVSCGTCHGSGAKAGTSPVTCTTCDGHGQVRFSQGFFSMARVCPDCGGTGHMIKNPCPDCGGQGRKRQEKTINVKIPPGVDGGTRMRLSGEGEAGLQGAKAGDLYIFISLKPHHVFQRVGNDVHLDVPICMTDAALGSTVEVPTVGGGRAKLAVPEGTQSGDKLRLKGKGMPVLNRGQFGDLIVTMKVEVPTKLSKKQREMVEELRSEMGSGNTPAQKTFFDKVKKLMD